MMTRFNSFLSRFVLTILSAIFLFTANGHASLSNNSDSTAVSSENEDTVSTHSDTSLLRTINGKIGKQPVYSELVSHGLAPAEVLSLSKSFKSVFDFRRARPNDEYSITLSSTNQLEKFTYKTDLLNQFVARKTPDGTFEIFKKDITLSRELIAKELVLESNLYQTITASGEGPQLVSAFVDIFSWDIDFYLYPRKGDKIVLLFEQFTKDGVFVKYGDILAAKYLGKNGSFSAFFFNDGKVPAYYDEEGHLLRKMFLRVPVKFGHQTSSYSIRRFHPISKKYKKHTGIDYGAPSGTSIFATAGGKVKFSGWKGGYGKLLILRHANGYETYYGHCSKLLVNSGQFIKQGQTIARVGRTGTATGSHVHYEIRVNGKPINPKSVKTMKGNPLKADLLAEFKKTVEERMQFVTHQIAQNSGTRLVSLNP